MGDRPDYELPFDPLLYGWDVTSWAYRALIRQLKEWTPTRVPRTISSADNVNPLDALVLISGNTTATLETAVGADGRQHIFVKTDSSATTATIACTGSETVGGSATLAWTAQYAGFVVYSDGTNWQTLRLDMALALGTLAVAHGGTGATTASAAWKTLSASQTPLPLVSWGGMNFNGTTTYLDTNALTGIADGKKGSICLILRFANAASAQENIFQNTSGRLAIQRTATGNLTFQARNSGNTLILDQVTTGTPCASAGTYVILASWDQAVGFTIYVNDVAPSVTSNTLTNDTIDYTVTEYAIGASATGANFFAGDFYALWFDPTSTLAFATESVRRKFADTNNVPVYLGNSGELPTGSRPIGFWAYGNSDYWFENRGSANSTIFTKNGAIADATTTLYGQRLEGIWHSWTPTLTSWTNVGSPTVTGRYCQIGNKCFFQVKVAPATSVATTAGTSYISLPLTANPQSASGSGSMQNITSKADVYGVIFDTTNSRCYVPTEAASTHTFVIAGWYET